MKISVCVDAVYHGQDFVESMKSIKNAGINAIEFWSWWDKDLDRILEAKKELDMEIAAFCTKFTSLVDGSKHPDYMEGLRESIKTAEKMGCRTLITQVGDDMKEVSREEQHKNLVKGLKACAPILEEKGITLVFEPLNTLVDHKGYYLSDSRQAFAVADEVGSPNVKVLYDIYHQQIMEGNLISAITGNIEKIGHFHAAGNPGRHELTIGEINYREVFKAIDASGYKGFVGLEYFPVNPVAEGLKKLFE